MTRALARLALILAACALAVIVLPVLMIAGAVVGLAWLAEDARRVLRSL